MIETSTRICYWKKVFWILFTCAFIVCTFIYLPDLKSTKSLWIGAISGALGVLFAALKSFIFVSENNTKINKFLILPYVLPILAGGGLSFYYLGISSTVCFVSGAILASINEYAPDEKTAKTSLSLGLALFGVSILYYVFKDAVILCTFPLAAAVCGLFTKNPKTLFSIFSMILVSAIYLGSMSLNLMGAFLPLIFSGYGIFIYIFSCAFEKKPVLNTVIQFVLFNIISFMTIKLWLDDFYGLFYVVFAGSVFSLIIKYFDKNFLVYFLGAAAVTLGFLLIGGIHFYNLGAYGIAIFSLCTLYAVKKPSFKYITFLGLISALYLFISVSTIKETDLINPFVIAGLIAGIGLPFLFQKSENIKFGYLPGLLIALLLPLIAGKFYEMQVLLAMFAGLAFGVVPNNSKKTVLTAVIFCITSVIFAALYVK